MENVFITWHSARYGIAYLKHILSAFYIKKSKLKNKIEAFDFNVKKIDKSFNSSQNGFLFDKIYYLTAKEEVFNKIYTKNNNQIKGNLLSKKSLKYIRTHIENKDLTLQQLYQIIKENHKTKIEDFKNFIWSIIGNFKIEEQIWWFKTESNLKQFYIDKIEIINMSEKEDLQNLNNYVQIAEKMINQLNKIFYKHKNANFIINPTLPNLDVQIVWFSVGSAGLLHPESRFIETKIEKEKKEIKKLSIKETPTNLVSQIKEKINIFESPTSKSRKLADAKMKTYIKSGFTVFLLGERGIGKTRLVEKYNENEKIINVNCASFTDNSIAESILFGYKKGAFTGAITDRKGVFEEASNGILFLDEIHHLDKLVQAKLMKAIETDKDNFFTIKRLGDNEERKIRTTLIFASNKNIKQLQKLLLPDFYDRITQLIIEMPPLRETKKELFNDFKNIWKQMLFEEKYNFDKYVKNDNNLKKWLESLELYGNYRDLQKISIYYKTYLDFNKETKKIIAQKNPFEFTKDQFEKYASFNYENQDNDNIDFNLTPNQNVKKFKKHLADKLIKKYGSVSKASEKYNDIDKRTIYNWINEK